MKTIRFSTNWNKKLNCDAFTTFRIHNTQMYIKDELYIVEGKGVEAFMARILEIRIIKLSQVNEFMARIDTGYSMEDFKKIVRTMYKDKADTSDFDFILFLREKR